MYTLYSTQDSANCYKVRLLLSQAAMPYRIVDIDSRRGGTRSLEFLAINPFGKVPVLMLSDGRTLAESNAILVYLAQGSPYLPEERFERAKVMEWLFFEQYSHEPYIATARSRLALTPGGSDSVRDRIGEWHDKGGEALRVMDRHLAAHEYFVGDRYTIADIALYAATHVAGEGGFDLASYPRVAAWLSRVAGQARHVGMDHRPPAA